MERSRKRSMEEKVIGGRYKYRKSLGKGGNGSVFLCHDIKLQKEWAVKELVEHATELELLKSISCNLFPRIVDVVHEQEKVYLVMDYVEGITLKEKMQRQQLTEKEVLPWAVEIAKALQYLHKMSPQILYMDCKPENIILTPQGEIRLVDLGSVYICGSEKKQRVSGTRFFSPLEQKNAATTESAPDVRTDIYSFGMTLYYLLAGEKKIYRRKGRMSIQDVNPGVSEGMNAIIARCTEKEPSKRLQSMEEVLYQLAHIKEIGRQERIKNSMQKALGLFGKIVCVAGSLICAWVYAKGQNPQVFFGAVTALAVFGLLCRRRYFILYEVKKEVFCGSGKRVLLYMLILWGVLRIMTVSVFAEERAELQELQVTLYDWQGRKLLLKDGIVWKASEDILLSIPLEELEKTEGKIMVLYKEKDGEIVKQYEFSCCRK